MEVSDEEQASSSEDDDDKVAKTLSSQKQVSSAVPKDYKNSHTSRISFLRSLTKEVPFQSACDAFTLLV